MANDGIWWNQTWNPVTGCTPVSEGCRNCWAKRMATRLRGRCGYDAEEPFKVTVRPERFGQPAKWRKHRDVAMCLMSDIFHEKIPAWTQHAIWGIMECFERHSFYVLTKRPRRAETFLDVRRVCGYRHTDNIKVGFSAESQKSFDERMEAYLDVPLDPIEGFVSLEPLLGPIDIDDHLWSFSWVIAGAETGPGARPCDPDWIRSIRDQCVDMGVPFWLKSLGPGKGRELDGRTWEERPE